MITLKRERNDPGTLNLSEHWKRVFLSSANRNLEALKVCLKIREVLLPL